MFRCCALKRLSKIGQNMANYRQRWKAIQQVSDLLFFINVDNSSFLWRQKRKLLIEKERESTSINQNVILNRALEHYLLYQLTVQKQSHLIKVEQAGTHYPSQTKWVSERSKLTHIV